MERVKFRFRFIFKVIRIKTDKELDLDKAG